MESNVATTIHLVAGLCRPRAWRIGFLDIRTNGLLHCLQDNVGAYGIELEDCGSKTFHKVLDGLRSPHPDVEKAGDALFPPKLTHILSHKIFR